MPRKVNYGAHYDEEYDIYDQYDYDYDPDISNDEEIHDEVDQETIKPGLWSCSICTFDNDESMSLCEICGVLREPLVKNCSNGTKKTVGDMYKDSGASVMAKSLFASSPPGMPKVAKIFQQQNHEIVRKQDNNFHRIGNGRGKFSDLYKAFTPMQCNYHNIAPFKFDCPSPDDLVSFGKQSSKMVSKAIEKDRATKLQQSAEMLDRLSISMPQVGGSSVDEGDSSSVNADKAESLSSSSKNVQLNVKSGSLKNKKATPGIQYKPEKWISNHEEGMLTQLNLAIVGHVDSGKSTLSGRLLHLLGRVSQKEMHKYEKEAKLRGKGSFAYAWAMDESSEERERGVTMTVAVAYFNTKKYHVVLLDSPGHKDFVPNMISGAAQADTAIIVIDASVGSFEAGMDSKGGQTREHAQLIRSFGVDQIIVAVNKMDAVKYSKDRFDFIKVQVGTFLRSCGFKDSFISWIPLSAMENQNLVNAASDVRLSSWYQGPHLLDAIDQIQLPERDLLKPLLMPICDVIRSHSHGQVAACGKLEAGALRNGLKVLVMPLGDLAQVSSLERDSKPCPIARAGDNVAVCLKGIDGGHLTAGGVLCHPDFPVAVATHLEMKVLMLDVPTPIVIGSQVEFHAHHAKESASVSRILSLFDQKTGKVTKKSPRCLTSKQSAFIEVVLNGAVCVDEFSTNRALGRAFLRASGRTVAVGIVTKIIE